MALFRQTGWIGIDVGTHGVKLAQVVRTADGVRLHRAAVIQRPEPWPASDELALTSPAASAAEINAALDCGRFTGRNAAAVLPMNVCQFRTVSVPPGSDRERRSMISGELADEWEDRLHLTEFDFWEFDSSEKSVASEGMDVGVLAAARPWVTQVVNDFQNANLYCWALDGTPLAIARAVGMVAHGPAVRRLLAIDWGFSNTTLCIVGDGRPLYARRVQECALRRLLEEVGEAMDVTPDRARHLVDSEGVIDPGRPVGDQPLQRAITEASARTIEKFVGEIRRTLHFVASQRSLNPSACWLMGGGASIRHIGPYLRDILDMPVHVWQLPSDEVELPCTAGNRSAVFGGAAALSALAWEAA